MQYVLFYDGLGNDMMWSASCVVIHAVTTKKWFVPEILVCWRIYVYLEILSALCEMAQCRLQSLSSFIVPSRSNKHSLGCICETMRDKQDPVIIYHLKGGPVHLSKYVWLCLLRMPIVSGKVWENAEYQQSYIYIYVYKWLVWVGGEIKTQRKGYHHIMITYMIW